MNTPASFHVATDIVVFTIRADVLNVLLIERASPPFKGNWALPGGFLNENEGLDQCAARELVEETGVRGVYLEQLGSFGDPGRDPRGGVVSVAYFALVPADEHALLASTDAASAQWFAFDDVPKLAFDHDKILQAAHARLKAKLDYSTIAFCLLPAEFTLSNLQMVYEIIKTESLDKRNFRKWVLALDVLEETGEKRAEGAHRPAMLYREKNPGTIKIIR